MVKQSSTRTRALLSGMGMGLTLCTALACPAVSIAAVNVSQTPLIVGQVVDPNIMMTLDDSGSMQFEFMPENPLSAQVSTAYLYPQIPKKTYGVDTYRRPIPTFKADDVVNAYFRSAATNKIYYNPQITYKSWSTADGAQHWTPADPQAAYWNPADKTGETFDLTTEKIDAINRSGSTSGSYGYMYTGESEVGYSIDVDCGNKTESNSCNSGERKEPESFWPMVYWIYNGGDSDGDKYDVSNYTRIELRGPKEIGSFAITKYDANTDSMQVNTNATEEEVRDVTGVLRSYDEAVQNFANWFQYYRSRALLAKAGIGKAFAQQGENMRVGFTTINNNGIILGVQPFSGIERQAFFDKLYNQNIPKKGTPLRKALARVGNYFEDGSGNNSPWNNIPGDSDSGQFACRQNYNVLTTDGYWNGSQPSGIGNADDTSGQSITSADGKEYAYSPGPPYADGYSVTLADVAMHYWKRDLRTDMPNIVATSGKDPAFWQHMVNFTVGLGVFGSLKQSDLEALRTGSKVWPDPMDSEDSRRIDDLFHAAVNSRGEFFSAADPVEFAKALSDTLTAIISRIGSAASAATNTGLAVPGATQIFKPLYHSGSWTGDLVAYSFDTDSRQLAPTAHARDKLDGQGWNTGREILSYDAASQTGVAFRWDKISQNQQAILNQDVDGDVDNQGKERLQYLRGNRTLEDPAGTPVFRPRSAVLGDIVHSTPVYIGAPGALLNMAGYAAFRTAHAQRPAMIYVGANDGMLHAFRADQDATTTFLTEALAYVPAGVYENLNKLTDPDYGHHYFVDGTPAIADVDFDDTDGNTVSAWHTVLVGTTAAGGKSVFALDVTGDPNSTTYFSEAAADDRVLWEINPAWSNDYADLGYTFSRPTIVKMNNGQWVAIFGNGYGSTSGKAVLYIADIENGTLIRKFELDAGTGNGLSTPVAIDVDNDDMADRIYAGDLRGNLWAIDVSSDSKSDWQAAFTSAGKPAPLFKGDAQHPITVRPAVVRNPAGGQVVLFGTGKFFEASDAIVDAASEPVQSFYGVWDSGTASQVQPDDLVEQDIIQLATEGTDELRIVTKKAVDYGGPSPKSGWRIKLDVSDSIRNGERVVRAPVLRPHKLIFTTMIPSDNPCDGGGTGWLMEVNPLTGSRLAFSAFDMNGDGQFSKGDYVEIQNPDGDGMIKVPVSGVKPAIGVPTRPAIVIDPDSGNEYKFITGSTGNSAVVPNNAGPGLVIGRQSWHQLK